MWIAKLTKTKLVHSLETKFEDLNPVDTIELHIAYIVTDLFVIEVVETHGLPDFCIHGNDL